MLVFLKLALITLLVDSPTGIKHLRSGFPAPSTSVRGVGDLVQPAEDFGIFRGGSVDYGLNPVWETECEPFDVGW